MFIACALLPAGLTGSAGGAADRPVGESVGALSIPAGVAADDVREIVVYSLAAREWTVRSTEGDWVVGYLQHRGHAATISFVLRDNEIGVYCEGYAINKRGERKKPELPHAWINNLKNDITKRLQVKATLL